MLRHTPDGVMMRCAYCARTFPVTTSKPPDMDYCPDPACVSNTPEARHSFAQTLAALSAEAFGTFRYHRNDATGGYMACLDDVIALAHYFEEESHRAEQRHPGVIYWGEVGDWYIATEEAARLLTAALARPDGNDLYDMVIEAFAKAENAVKPPPI